MDLFAYGTLRSHLLMAAVAGDTELSAEPAVLWEHRVQPIEDDVVPLIVPMDSAHADGVLWSDLTTAQTERLDTYEGAFGYTLTEVLVEVAGEKRPAHCYLPPAGLEPTEGDWSLEEWEATHLAPAVLAAEELFSYRPRPDHAALRRMWPMIETRAWAKHRSSAAPATLRRNAEAGDFAVVAERPPHGSFHRFQSLDVTHKRFDGDRSHVLVREAFFAVDAAMVLPFDPARDKVALLEQVRLGPGVRQDPNPWMLEPIAGIVDAREDPEMTARREAKEEAGLTLRHIEPAGQYYPSPGATTDYFYTYVGLCDLRATRPYAGGLPEEHEDLRIHTVAFDHAMELAETGEIATGPLLHLLYWLALHKDRLVALS